MSRQYNYIREILGSPRSELETWDLLMRYRKADLLEVLMDLYQATRPQVDTPVTPAASERPNTDTKGFENAPDAQLEGSDGK